MPPRSVHDAATVYSYGGLATETHAARNLGFDKVAVRGDRRVEDVLPGLALRSGRLRRLLLCIATIKPNHVNRAVGSGGQRVPAACSGEIGVVHRARSRKRSSAIGRSGETD